MDCALTLVAGGRPVKLVSECLGVARSQLTVRIKQSVSPKVRRSRPVDDAELVVEIQQQVSELPSYGYRRVWGLLRRERETQSLPAINVKRVYRVMRDHNLLLERRIKQPGVPRRLQRSMLRSEKSLPSAYQSPRTFVDRTVGVNKHGLVGVLNHDLKRASALVRWRRHWCMPII